MRIYRDIRFSRDKTPYKTWMAALIAKGGKKSGRAGYGLRLAPGDTVAAGGYWEPKPEQLAAFRSSVDRDPQAHLAPFSRIRNSHGPSGASWVRELKTAPQGYAKDHPAVDLLRLKQIYVARRFEDRAVCAGDFADHLVETFRIMKPFVDYLNDAVP